MAEPTNNDQDTERGTASFPDTSLKDRRAQFYVGVDRAGALAVITDKDYTYAPRGRPNFSLTCSHDEPCRISPTGAKNVDPKALRCMVTAKKLSQLPNHFHEPDTNQALASRSRLVMLQAIVSTAEPRDQSRLHEWKEELVNNMVTALSIEQEDVRDSISEFAENLLQSYYQSLHEGGEGCRIPPCVAEWKRIVDAARGWRERLVLMIDTDATIKEALEQIPATQGGPSPTLKIPVKKKRPHDSNRSKSKRAKQSSSSVSETPVPSETGNSGPVDIPPTPGRSMSSEMDHHVDTEAFLEDATAHRVGHKSVQTDLNCLPFKQPGNVRAEASYADSDVAEIAIYQQLENKLLINNDEAAMFDAGVRAFQEFSNDFRTHATKYEYIERNLFERIPRNRIQVLLERRNQLIKAVEDLDKEIEAVSAVSQAPRPESVANEIRRLSLKNLETSAEAFLTQWVTSHRTRPSGF